MKKNIINIKGFAMSELLAASIVILLLFSILFANYLPLVAEFENRSLYNNVTSNYGLFYVRKIYRDVLSSSETKEYINDALNEKSFYTIYKGTDSETDNLIVEDAVKTRFEDIIKEYNVEEIIITKYKLDDVKGKSKAADPPTKYQKSDGSLYGYIKYLPLYTKSEYGTDQLSEPYRLIMKTKDFGYATTQILPDPPTPISCFTLVKKLEGQFSIVDYNEDTCGSDVTITSDEITHGGEVGIITSITGSNNKGAFQGKGIKSIHIAKSVTTIGASAFKENNISKLDFEEDAPGVLTIENDAFSDNNLSSVEITKEITSIGKGAFANNYSLKTIDLSKASFETIRNNMFALSNPNNAENKVNIFIPAQIKVIEDSAFKNLQFSSIEFEDSEQYDDQDENEASESPSILESIGASAFETKFIDDTNYLSLSIPSSVRTIGNNAFKNVKFGRLIFKNEEINLERDLAIGESAFEVEKVDMSKIEKENFCNQSDNSEGNEGNSTTCGEYIRSLVVPTRTNKILASAFKNQLLSSIVFEETDENGNVIGNNSHLTTLGTEAFAGNALRMFTIPELLAKSGTIGDNIFGTDYNLGNEIGDIIVIKDLLNSMNWCKPFFGEDCTDGTPKEYIDNPEEIEPDENSRVFIYKHGNKTKYITYVNNNAS